MQIREMHFIFNTTKTSKVMFSFEKYDQTDINIQEKMSHNW